MVLLQMSGQGWQREDISNPASMPYGKVPVLRATGHTIPDSECIQDWLAEQGSDFYPGCSDDQKVIGQSLIRMVEDGIRLALVHDRWLDDRCWPLIWPVFFAAGPRPIRKLIATKARNSVKRGLWGHGIGRLSLKDR